MGHARGGRRGGRGVARGDRRAGARSGRRSRRRAGGEHADAERARVAEEGGRDRRRAVAQRNGARRVAARGRSGRALEMHHGVYSTAARHARGRGQGRGRVVGRGGAGGGGGGESARVRPRVPSRTARGPRRSRSRAASRDARRAGGRRRSASPTRRRRRTRRVTPRSGALGEDPRGVPRRRARGQAGGREEAAVGTPRRRARARRRGGSEEALRRPRGRRRGTRYARAGASLRRRPGTSRRERPRSTRRGRYARGLREVETAAIRGFSAQKSARGRGALLGGGRAFARPRRGLLLRRGDDGRARGKRADDAARVEGRDALVDRAREVRRLRQERVPREDEAEGIPKGVAGRRGEYTHRRPGDGPRVGAAAARVRILRIVSDAADGFFESRGDARGAPRGGDERRRPASDGVRAGYTPSRAAAREIETLVKSLRF